VAGIFLFATAFRQVLGPTKPPIQQVPGRETDHSAPFSADVKNAWSYTSTSPIFLHGVVHIKQRDNFALLYRIFYFKSFLDNFSSSVIANLILWPITIQK
jgi:hypothetical protein